MIQTAVVRARGGRRSRTGIRMVRGRSYRFSAEGGWWDASIPSPPEGYDDKRFRAVEKWRDLPTAPWFALLGRIGPKGAPFLIGNGWEDPSARTRRIVIQADADGELFCWPNDLWFLRWNNRGSITLTVEELE